MVAILTLLTIASASFAAASPVSVERRDVTAVRADLAALATTLTTLDTDLKAWNGTVKVALQIAFDDLEVAGATNKATAALTAHGPVGFITTKHGDAVTAGVTKPVKNLINVLKTDTDALIDALIANLYWTDVPAVQLAKLVIDGAFAAAVNAYASD